LYTCNLEKSLLKIKT